MFDISSIDRVAAADALVKAFFAASLRAVDVTTLAPRG
jgi:hypothetical protein